MTQNKKIQVAMQLQLLELIQNKRFGSLKMHGVHTIKNKMSLLSIEEAS
jgi:hypothetical protein